MHGDARVMLKPVSILALDDVVAPLAHAVQQRVAAHHSVEDLVQARVCKDNLEAAIQSMHAQRQRPDAPLRMRDDVGARELVLVMVAAAGPARMSLLETTRRPARPLRPSRPPRAVQARGRGSWSQPEAR